VGFFGDADMDTMLADWGHSITIGGITKSCLKDQRHERRLEHDGGAGQKVHVIEVKIKTTDFPTVKNGDACVVDGVNYTIWDSGEIEDGALTLLFLRKV